MIAYYFALAAAITGNMPDEARSYSYLELLKPAVMISPPGNGKNPVPTGNPGLWVTTNDYPAAALRELRDGMVGFSLAVGPDGKVSACEIMSSSGSADLDAAACTLITQRARFTPARSANGKAMSGRYANRVRWQIPSKGQNVAWNVPIPKPGQANLTFVVDENGKPSNCALTGSSIIEAAKTPCDVGVTFQPYYNAAGERIRVKVQTSQTINVTEENDADLKAQ
jgi:periplasmic protein TonB